jgi:hypothetical protein
MNLSRDIKDELQIYLERAERVVGEIESGKRENMRIHNNDFLDPTLEGNTVPFNDQVGELVYYRNIANAMRFALEHGRIPRQYTPFVSRAPEMIRALLVGDNPRID